MRAFLGVGLDAHARALLRQWREQQVTNWYWVTDTNLHMTVVFLGQLPEAQLPLLDKLISPIAAAQAAIDLQWRSVACFPSVDDPRVLAWLPASSDALQQWQWQLVQALQAAGFAADTKPYRPHISLARVRRREAMDWQVTHLPHAMRIDGLSLFRSDSTPQGVRYTAVQHWPLGACR